MKFTVGQVIESIEKNGYPWAKGQFYNPYTKASCAIGQAVRNLGFQPGKGYFFNGAGFTPIQITFTDVCWQIYDAMNNAIYKAYPETHLAIDTIISINDRASSIVYSDVVEEIKAIIPVEAYDIEFEVPITEF